MSGFTIQTSTLWLLCMLRYMYVGTYMFENRFLSTWNVIMLDNLHILVLYIVSRSLRSCHNFDKDYEHMIQTIYCPQLKFLCLKTVFFPLGVLLAKNFKNFNYY